MVLVGVDRVSSWLVLRAGDCLLLAREVEDLLEGWCWRVQIRQLEGIRAVAGADLMLEKLHDFGICLAQLLLSYLVLLLKLSCRFFEIGQFLSEPISLHSDGVGLFGVLFAGLPDRFPDSVLVVSNYGLDVGGVGFCVVSFNVSDVGHLFGVVLPISDICMFNIVEILLAKVSKHVLILGRRLS